MTQKAKPATPSDPSRSALRDSYSPYEAGLRQLLERLGQGHSRYQEALVYQQRLSENIAQSRLHGDTEMHKAERAQIIGQLNALTMSACGVSFNELCCLTPPEPFESPGPR